MPLLRIYFSEKQKKVVTFDNLFLFPNIINTNRTVIILTIDLDNLPSIFPEILQQERAVVAQWKQEGFLEQLYLRPTKNGAVLLFKDKTEEEGNQLMTTLPFYPLRKSIETLPLINDEM